MPRKSADDDGPRMVLRCPECRTRRTDPRLMAFHRIHCKRPLCDCMRVPHPHRPGSYPLCKADPMSDVRLARMHGASDEEAADIALEIMLTQPFKPSPANACPF